MNRVSPLTHLAIIPNDTTATSSRKRKSATPPGVVDLPGVADLSIAVSLLTSSRLIGDWIGIPAILRRQINFLLDIHDVSPHGKGGFYQSNRQVMNRQAGLDVGLEMQFACQC
jgi:hypothetical protein